MRWFDAFCKRSMFSQFRFPNFVPPISIVDHQLCFCSAALFKQRYVHRSPPGHSALPVVLRDCTQHPAARLSTPTLAEFGGMCASRVLHIPLSGRDRQHYAAELRKAEREHERLTKEAAAAHAAAGPVSLKPTGLIASCRRPACSWVARISRTNDR
jgi:hypothetical protein